jgi:hypothetical protein
VKPCVTNNTNMAAVRTWEVGTTPVLYNRTSWSLVWWQAWVHKFVQKSGSYLKILGAGWVTWSKFHPENRQILGATVQNFVARATRRPGFVNLWWKDACSTFFVKRATWAEFDLHVGIMNFNTQNEAWISMRVIICILLTVYSSINHVQLKYTESKRKNLLKMQFTTKVRVSLF